MDKKQSKDEQIEEVRRAETSRGRRPIDLESKRQRQELLRGIKKLLDLATEAEFVEAMLALGLERNSPELREVLETWRQHRS